MFTCPANHSSETPEFCSVCGLEIPGAAPTVPPPRASAVVVEGGPVAPSAAEHDRKAPDMVSAGGKACPDCGAPRENDQHVFCEVCGYNFATRVAGSGPPPSCLPAPAGAADPVNSAAEGHSFVLASASAPLSPGAPAENGGLASRNAARWELIITVNANLYGTPNPDAPVGQPPRKFRLFDRETIIGRAGTEVRVQVPVHGDAGVSRRQALLIQGPDGSLLLRDLNSANGTRVNGVNVLPGVNTLLDDGAAIAIGAWTSIIVRRVDVG